MTSHYLFCPWHWLGDANLAKAPAKFNDLKMEFIAVQCESPGQRLQARGGSSQQPQRAQQGMQPLHHPGPTLATNAHSEE